MIIFVKSDIYTIYEHLYAKIYTTITSPENYLTDLQKETDESFIILF